MEIIYYYSIGSEGISGKGFNLHNKFEINEESEGLKLTERIDYVKDVFSQNISQVKVIVGENGVGKTTLLNSISRLVAEGNDWGKSGKFDFFIVYKMNGKFFSYELDKTGVNTKIEGVIKVDLKTWQNHLKFLSNFYYSPHLDKLYSQNIFDTLQETKIKGRYDISTVFIYRQLIESSLGEQSKKITEKFVKIEQLKYLKLFAKGELNEYIKAPKFLLIAPNLQKGDAIIDSRLEFLMDSLDFRGEKKQVLNRMLLIRIINSIFGEESTEKKYPNLSIKILKENLEVSKGANNEQKILRALRRTYRFNEDDRVKLNIGISLINLIKVQPDNQIINYGLTFEIASDIFSEKLKKLNNIKLFETDYDFLNVKLTNDFMNYNLYSSGEYTMIGLFSRLYDNRFRMRKHNLLLLDESEVSLHPRWQRMFLQELISFLMRNFPTKKFQILLTTHSPIILSDIPKFSLLKMSNNEITNKNPDTFGANIHELYSTDFGLGESLIGEFASRYIRSLILKINNIKEPLIKEEFTQIYKQIEIIGEPFIQSKLKRQLSKWYNESATDNLIYQKEQELKELRRMKRENND